MRSRIPGKITSTLRGEKLSLPNWSWLFGIIISLVSVIYLIYIVIVPPVKNQYESSARSIFLNDTYKFKDSIIKETNIYLNSNKIMYSSYIITEVTESSDRLFVSLTLDNKRSIQVPLMDISGKISQVVANEG